MGKARKIGSRHERYSRVSDTESYRDNYDTIFGKKGDVSKQRGRTLIKIRDGKRVVAMEDGEVIDKSEVPVCSGNVTLYDLLKEQQ
jgi:hypothetical protein